MILAAGLCLLWMGAAMTTSTTKTRTYAADDSAFPNAQIGYAPMIDTAEAGDAALRYLELTWREAEPKEGVYAWEAISEKYDFASLREQGIHLVLRFVCDVPGQETHLDIPDWLYAQTKDGSWYDTDYGKATLQTMLMWCSGLRITVCFMRWQSFWARMVLLPMWNWAALVTGASGTSKAKMAWYPCRTRRSGTNMPQIILQLFLRQSC